MQGVKIILGILLLAESVIDIRSKHVLVWMPLLAGIIGVGYSIIGGNFRISEVGASLVVVFILFMISKLTKEALGMGDIWVIGSILITMGFVEGIKIIFLAFLLAGTYGGTLMLVKKCGGKKRIPFIPFLFLGFIGGEWIC